MQPVEVTWSSTDVAIITLLGEHDIATKETLTKTLRSLVRAGEQVVVDLSVAEFIDSSVVNALIEADRLARQRGSAVVLQLGTTSVVERAIEVTGILKRLRFARSREEAIKAARSNGRTAGA